MCQVLRQDINDQMIFFQADEIIAARQSIQAFGFPLLQVRKQYIFMAFKSPFGISLCFLFITVGSHLLFVHVISIDCYITLDVRS